ncbi:MAG: alpha/beta hydrolase, partial [Rhodospirillaceae bacterium]|nr:alpha/beta hydrolase [Rhodospirillaceae bacterium]
MEPVVFGSDNPSAEHGLVVRAGLGALTLIYQAMVQQPPNVELARAAHRLSAPLGEAPGEIDVRHLEFANRRSEWFSGPETDDSRRMLYLHGGGYIMGGDLDAHRAMIAWIAQESRCSVLAIDYRMGPEHRHPAALEDALAACELLSRQSPDNGQPAHRLFVGGDSAGGGLALGVTYSLRDSERRVPDALFLIGPMTRMPVGALAKDAVNEMETAVAEQYVRAADALDPTVSPLYGDAASLPPVLLQVGEDFDTPWAREFARKAESDGVDLTFQQWRHMGHVW